jgi:hypothetical protein
MEFVYCSILREEKIKGCSLNAWMLPSICNRESVVNPWIQLRRTTDFPNQVRTRDKPQGMSRKPVLPNPPRFQASSDPSSIQIPGLDRTASVNDQIDQIEQLITFKLQVGPPLPSPCFYCLITLHRTSTKTFQRFKIFCLRDFYLQLNGTLLQRSP